MFGKIMTIFTFALMVFCTITFGFVKKNSYFGIRTKITMMSEDIWHKAHIAGAIATVPFDVILLLIMIFVEASETQLWLTLLTIIIWSIVVLVVSGLAVREDAKKKKIHEEKELKEQIKKESGYRIWVKK
ncbi:MAG: SdpI family protein [Bacilli bacterium]|nr:SdpI family protein [Bacilli bacterium]MDD4077677.1 SdpI family protein [Bacilli bacterium]